MKVLENHSIENSLQIKSLSKFYIELQNKNDFYDLHKFLLKNNLPILVIGECTNIVLSLIHI